MPQHHAHLFRLVAATVAAALLVACVRESDNPNEGVDPSGGGVVVEVRITDEGILMPDEIPAGSITFEVTNNGLSTHGFGIEETGEALDDLALDELDTLTVALEEGTYTAYSPIDVDGAERLERRFTIVEPDGTDRDPAEGGVGPSEEQDPIDDDEDDGL